MIREDKRMSVTGIISAAAAKKGLEKIVYDIYELSKDKVRKQVNRWKAKGRIDELYKKIKNIRMVKTIFQPEKAIDLARFYYPSKMKIGKERRTINDISELNSGGKVVVKGTVGQGKSIFFRYLASREMLKGEGIPIFIELRRVERGENLIDYLIEEAKAFGLKEIDKDIFEWLAEQGKVVLLLDGFDEVPEDMRMGMITEIERLVKKYDNMKVLVSSRPNSGIETSPLFRVVEMAMLEGEEYKDVIEKMANDEQRAAEIIKGVEVSKGNMEHLLTTPLMVALLMVHYRIEQTIPDNVVAFYENLFGLLIRRHDKSKAGYVRPRKAGLGDNVLEELFNGICFLARKDRKGAFVFNDLVGYAENAGKLLNIKCEGQSAIEDIIQITCLILEEAGDCKFIHRSVQEYHAACFVKQQPDETARKFYENVQNYWRKWEEELNFLKLRDKYRFLKWFLVLDMMKLMNGTWETDIGEWLISNVSVTFEESKQERRKIKIVSTIWHEFRDENRWSLWRIVLKEFIHQIFNLDFSPALAQIEKGSIEYYNLKVALSDLITKHLMEQEIKIAIDKACEKLRNEYVSAEDFVNKVESRDKIFEF